MSDDVTDPAVRQVRMIVIPILIAVAGLGMLDLAFDGPRAWRSAHAALEVTLITVSLGGAAFLGFSWRRAAGSLAVTERRLAEQQAAAEGWRQRAEGALAGFRQAMDEQFARWDLTPAEREVAVLLLQGHGHKQIAFSTGRSERTVRQHAVAVYQKSGLAGRAELAAFFLDGLRPSDASRA